MNSLTLHLPTAELMRGLAVFLRVAAFVSVVPVWGAEMVPVKVRIGFGLLLTALLVPIVQVPVFDGDLLKLAASETVVGLLIGSAARVVLDAALAAGTMAGFPSGISMASMLDPLTQSSSAVLGVIYRTIGGLIFMAIGGHHEVLAALVQSYHVVPIGGVKLGDGWVSGSAAITGRVLVAGVRIAGPVLVSGLLLDLALLLINRAVPQMNAMIVGAPARLICGLLSVGFSLQLLAPITAAVLDGTMQDLSKMLQLISGAR